MNFIDRLARYQRIVLLRKSGWTLSEIAQDVGCSRVTVHTNIHWAVKVGDLPHANRIKPPAIGESEAA